VETGDANYTDLTDGGATTLHSHAGGAAHAILDGSTHSDSVAQGVTRGSLIKGNSTPAWDELVLGISGTYLRSDGNDPSWQTPLVTRIHKLRPSAAPGAAIVAGTLQDFSFTGNIAETVISVTWVCLTVGTTLSFTVKHTTGDITYTTGQSFETINTQAIGTSQGDRDTTMTGDTTIPALSLIALDIDSLSGTYADLIVFVETQIKLAI